MNKFFNAAMFNQSWLMGKADIEGIIHQARNITSEQMAAALINTSGKKADPAPYVVRDGVAVISIRGALTKEAYYWSYFSDSAIRTFSDLLKAAAIADADPAVEKKLLDIDCNGSTVAGCFETMAALNKSGQIKPFYTFANSNMKSGGMLIGSVGKTIAATKTAEIGSIGVRSMHIDESKLNEKIGFNVTHMAAGRYKTMGNPDEPLSPEAKEYFQDHLDTTYTLFVDAIAQNRTMSTDAVLQAADGRVFLGVKAKENGLVDLLVDDLDSFITLITTTEEPNMDLSEFKTKHPDLYNQVHASGVTDGKRLVGEDMAAQITAAETTARTAGQDAVMAAVSVICGPEMTESVKKLTAAGLTADQLTAAMAVFKPKAPETTETPETPAASADEQSRKNILTAIQQAGNVPASGGNPPAAGPESFEAAMSAIQLDKKCSKGDALKEAAKLYPDLHDKFIADANKGKK